MSTRRIMAIATTVVLTLGMAACGSDDDGGSSAGETPYIAIVSKGFQHQFWQAVKQGAEAEAKKQGVKITFEGPAAETDVEDQMTMLTNALAKQPAAKSK